jgi:2'-5' RNA ligase
LPFAVHLDLDAAADHDLREIAACVVRDAADVVETVHGLGDRHHISLAVYDELPSTPAVAALRRLAAAVPSLTVTLANIGVFPGERSVLFVSPVVTRDLLALHQRTHRLFARFAGAGWEYYRPGAWVPHVTIAMNLLQSAAGAAVGRLARQWQPGAVRCEAIRLVRFRPVETVCRFELAPPP